MLEIIADCKSENDAYAEQIWDDVCKDFLGAMIFENEGIVKIFHGCQTGSANGDLAWIQRDLGVRCRNVFDTQEYYRLCNAHEITRKKEKNRHLYLSLSAFWKQFGCQENGEVLVDLKKKRELQRSDWS